MYGGEDGMGDRDLKDEVLLARLNKLRPSTVARGSSVNADSADVDSGTDKTPEDLIARFERLHGRQANDVTAVAPPTCSAEGEEAPPSPTIEELLAELDTDEMYRSEGADIKEARDLMTEAGRIMPAEADTTDDPSAADKATRQDEGPDADPDDDAEAEAALERILDEADSEIRLSEPVTADAHVESKPQSDLHPKTAEPDTFSALQFPTTPDTALESLELPSVPKDAPKTRTGQVKASAPKVADHTIETWCIICCNDAAVQCFGCDKDLYCWACWREGHMGEDAGLEERQHVWERYRKPGVVP